MAQITLNSTGVASNGSLVLQSNGTTTAVTIDTSQRAAFVAGTAALPAITTTGDTNTGIFFPAADTIAFSEGGVEAARIDSSSNVGIGTTSPASKLESVGTITSTKSSTNQYLAYTMKNSTQNYSLYVDQDNTGTNSFSLFDTTSSQTALRYYPSTSGFWQFYTNNTEAARIDSSGNLLVGTTTPVFNTAGRGLITINGSSAAALGFTAGAVDKGIILHTGTDMIMSNSVSGAITFQTNNQERARIDSSGNLGIGTSSPAGKLSVNVDASTEMITFRSSSGRQIFAHEPGGNARPLTIKAQTLTYADDSATRLVVDSSGNVGIGTSSPSYKLHVRGTDATAVLVVGNTSEGTQLEVLTYQDDKVVLRSNDTSNVARTLAFETGTTERARIDTSGRLLVGTTSPSPGYSNTNTGAQISGSGSMFSRAATDYVISVNQNTADGGTFYQIVFRAANGAVGAITSTSSTTSYTSLSDYRLKNTIAPITGALAKVAALKPVTYKWNSSNLNGDGFIAHELAEVCPQAVTGEKDAVDADGNPKYQGIDTSFLVATLTAAIQEQQALITQLTARLDAANL